MEWATIPHVGTSDPLKESEARNPEARSRYFKRHLAGGLGEFQGFRRRV